MVGSPRVECPGIAGFVHHDKLSTTGANSNGVRLAAAWAARDGEAGTIRTAPEVATKRNAQILQEKCE
jgi:hypothetical protein